MQAGLLKGGHGWCRVKGRKEASHARGGGSIAQDLVIAEIGIGQGTRCRCDRSGGGVFAISITLAEHVHAVGGVA